MSAVGAVAGQGAAGLTALVTGGSRGLGAGIAAALCDAGARVAVSARDGQALDRFVEDARRRDADAVALPADLSQEGEPERLVREAVAALGGLDALVHAAGHLVRRPALEYRMSDWDAVVAVHLRAAFELARATARSLVERGRPGSIVFVGSLTSARAGVPGTVAYASAKSGLLGLMRSLAVEWGPHGIRVNTLAAGFFPTALTADADGTPERRALHARIPLGRLGRPADLAGVALFLVSPASGYVTGETITVDGGWSVA